MRPTIARSPAIFAAKGRPRFNPLICHYPDAEAAFADVVANDRAQRLAAAFWPGPLTLVLPRRRDCAVSLLASAGLDTLAVRVPAHDVALALLRATGRPVAAPSANRSGQVSPTTAQHVLDGLSGRIAAVLDSGPCPVGVEFDGARPVGRRPVLLRPGGATVEAIEAIIGPVRRLRRTRSPARCDRRVCSPRIMRRRCRCGWMRWMCRRDEALLAFGPPLPGAGAVVRLERHGDLTEAAARLFAGLR